MNSYTKEPDDQADILAIIEAYLDGGVPVHEPGFRFAINVDPVQFSVSAARLSVQKQRSRRGQRRQENRKEGNAVGEAGNVRQRKGDKDRAVPVPKSVTAWNIELPSTEEATQPHVVVFPSFKPPIHASGFVHTSNSEGSDVSAKHNSTVSTTEKRNPGNDRDNRRKESSENEEHLGENILVTAFHRDCRLLYQASILNRIMQPTPPSLLPAFKRGPLQLTLPPSFYLSTALPSTSNSGSSSCTLDVNTFTRVQPPYTYLSARTSKRIQSLIAVGDSRHSLAIYQLDDLGVDESNEDENGSIGTLQLLHNSSFPCHGDSVSRGFAVSYLPVSGSGDDESKSLLFLHSISTSECGLLVQAFKLRVDASASPSSPVGDPVCISQSLDVEGGVSLSLHRLDRDNDIGADKGNIFRNRVHEEHREQWGEARERKKSAKDVCRHRNSSYIGLVSFASSSKDLYLSYVCMSAANDGVVYAAPSVRIGVGSAPSVDLMNSPTISSRHHRGNYYRRQEEQLQSQVSFSSFSPSLMVSIVASDGYCFNHHKANTQATPPICETEPYSVNTVLSYTYAPLINLLAAVYDDNESNDVDTDNDMGGGKSIHRQEFGPPTVDNESGIRLDRVSIIDPCTKGVLHGTYDFGANPSNALYIGPSASSNEMEIGLIAVHEGVNARSETTFTRNSSTMDDNSIDDETGGVCGTAVEFDGLIIDAWPLSPF